MVNTTLQLKFKANNLIDFKFLFFHATSVSMKNEINFKEIKKI